MSSKITTIELMSLSDADILKKMNELNNLRIVMFEDPFVCTDLYSREYNDPGDDQNLYWDKVIKFSFPESKIDLIVFWQTSDENSGTVGKNLFSHIITINW